VVRIPRWPLRLVAPVAAAILLSACGTRLQAPAATVDGRDISQDALQTELDLALSDPQLAQRVAGPEGDTAKADLTRQALASLIRQEVVGEYARAHGIVASSAEVDAALTAIVAQLGGQAQFDDLIRARGLTMARVNQLLEEQVLLEKIREDVADQLPSLPPDAAEEPDAAFQEWLTDLVADATVMVNPRFGRFDPRTGQVVPIRSTADLG
jgi:SurA-like protein